MNPNGIHAFGTLILSICGIRDFRNLIFRSECQQQVNGYSTAGFKKFGSRSEAQDFINTQGKDFDYEHESNVRSKN